MTTNIYRTETVSLDEFNTAISEIIQYGQDDQEESQGHYVKNLSITFPDPTSTDDILSSLPNLSNHTFVIDSQTINNDTALVFAL